MLKIIESESPEKGELVTTLDALAREGARSMLQEALQAEVAEYIARHASARDEHGCARVVRNGKAKTRQVTFGSGTVPITAPRVNDKRVDADGRRCKFSSSILPAYMRRSPKVAELLPILYLRGLSTGDFQPALTSLLGENASGLSSSSIARLTEQWSEERKAFAVRDLSAEDYVYIWADGIHFNVRLEDDRLCTLVVMGVRPDGRKEVLAVDDGYRESTESWSTVLRDLSKRGMNAPKVAVGDGALGFWAALRDVWPQTEQQACWVHRMGNVLDKLPKRLQPRAKALLREAMYADTKKNCLDTIEKFRSEFSLKYPKASKVLDDPALLTFYAYPAQHWRHLRTTNPIESAFATVRLRQRVTKGAGSRDKALLMAFKLLDMAQRRWRCVSGAHLLESVRRGERYVDGLPVNKVEEKAA